MDVRAEEYWSEEDEESHSLLGRLKSKAKKAGIDLQWWIKAALFVYITFLLFVGCFSVFYYHTSIIINL